MTETEWFTSSNTKELLFACRGRGYDRKLRLFAIGWCRLCWGSHAAPELLRAVELAEQYADGLAAREAADRVADEIREARQTRPDLDERAVWILMTDSPFVHAAVGFSVLSGGWGTWAGGLAERNGVLRDVVGNPFSCAVFDSRWRTSTALALARQMYGSRDFAAMPILADALQDAGCDSDSVLSHCRGDGPHVRGCWVVDKLLGKG